MVRIRISLFSQRPVFKMNLFSIQARTRKIRNKKLSKSRHFGLFIWHLWRMSQRISSRFTSAIRGLWKLLMDWELSLCCGSCVFIALISGIYQPSFAWMVPQNRSNRTLKRAKLGISISYGFSYTQYNMEIQELISSLCSQDFSSGTYSLKNAKSMMVKLTYSAFTEEGS